ncbi:hypothetical protein FW320_01680, partial [Azospirillum sp. Vi22]|nr:hypothetical protein [Azospirillum baldaniorum]
MRLASQPTAAWKRKRRVAEPKGPGTPRSGRLLCPPRRTSPRRFPCVPGWWWGCPPPRRAGGLPPPPAPGPSPPPRPCLPHCAATRSPPP